MIRTSYDEKMAVWIAGFTDIPNMVEISRESEDQAIQYLKAALLTKLASGNLDVADAILTKLGVFTAVEENTPKTTYTSHVRTNTKHADLFPHIKIGDIVRVSHEKCGEVYFMGGSGFCICKAKHFHDDFKADDYPEDVVLPK